MKLKIGLTAIVILIATLSAFFILHTPKATESLPVKTSDGLYKIGSLGNLVKKPEEDANKKTLRSLTAYVIPEISQEELLDYLKDDNACKIENSTFSFDDAAAALLKAPDILKVESDTDKVLSELFNKDKGAQSQEAQNITKFFNAVMLADLFFGTESAEVNYQKAHDLLEQLKAADPDNGAYDFVNAYVLSKLNAGDAQIKAEFLSAFQKKRADFYTDIIHKRLYEKSFATAGYWLVYLKILDRLDEVNVAPIAFLLPHYLDQGDTNFDKAAVHFAQLLIPDHVKEGPPPNLDKWEKSYYMFGQKILMWAWPKAYPGQTMPDYRPLKFLLVVNMNTVGQGEEALNNLTKSASNFYTCKRDLFDIWYTQNRIIEINRRE